MNIGSIPLRHLVYRVLDLPLSMQPLLYDFGQVTGKPEKDYITQIVTNHVSSTLCQNPLECYVSVYQYNMYLCIRKVCANIICVCNSINNIAIISDTVSPFCQNSVLLHCHLCRILFCSVLNFNFICIPTAIYHKLCKIIYYTFVHNRFEKVNSCQVTVTKRN